MSLGVLIKGSEGMVLAADSRVTLFSQVHPQGPTFPPLLLSANFDNATKVLRVEGQKHVGAVTYGLGAFMTPTGPRTMHSFIPEFDEELSRAKTGRLSIQDFAKRLSDFFANHWKVLVNRAPQPAEEISFLVGGYDDGAAYGRSFLFGIPNTPIPVEQNAGPGEFGITWGGQHDLVYRALYGFDAELPAFLQAHLNLTPAQAVSLNQELVTRFQSGLPFQFLPLQDCVDLAVFLIQSTITFQKFRTTILRGVGGPVEVATITRQRGFEFISQRRIAVNERRES